MRPTQMDGQVETETGQAYDVRLSTPLLDDQPSHVDLLNFEQYAVALRNLIRNPETRTPFIVGILGRWGSGKTTLMRLVERGLDQGATVVWFSAWLYTQEEEIWAAFLQSLSIRVIERLGFSDKARFSVRIFRRGLAWERLLYEVPKFLARALFVGLPIISASFLAQWTGEILGRLLNSAGIAGSVLLALWYGLRPGIEAVRKEVSPNLALFRPMDFEQHIGSLERFREQFERILNALPNNTRRLVVFVDDIDRCSPDKALQLLDAIKIFLDIPGCIFVLALDLSVLQKALVAKYPDDPVAQREYLAKIIQLPFHLPPLTTEDLTSYLRGLEVRFPDERCRDVFLSALAHNPREIKRVINSYSLTWSLAEASGISLRPVRLAKVIAIQQGFGPLFTLLREQPEWLGMLERALRVRAGQQLMPGPAQLSDVTLLSTSQGSGVPPAVSPYLEEPALQRMLTMHPMLSLAEDDANFASLSTQELGSYFTLTRRVDLTSQGSTTEAEAGAQLDGSLDKAIVFSDRYLLLRTIARGGMGTVYLANDRELGRKVAVKTMPATLAADTTWQARFRRETELQSHIPAHPNIANLLDSGFARDEKGQLIPFYAMDAVEGRTLEERLARDKLLSLEQVKTILVPILDALVHLRSIGIVHRDIKPSNIIIGTNEVPKLADFGLAIRPIDGLDELTAEGTILGTPSFMSPEQLTGKPLDARSDLYSFGLVLFEAITGKRAAASTIEERTRQLSQSPPQPSSVRPELAPMDGVVAKLLARDPDDRYPDPESARAALIRAIAQA